jgi:hypothetical protein
MNPETPKGKANKPPTHPAWYTSPAPVTNQLAFTAAGKPGTHPASATKNMFKNTTPMPPANPFAAIMCAPSRGGYKKTHKVYIVGGIIGNDWLLDGKYRYST